MAATAVYVGTTQGPVRITRLRADSGSFSVAMAHGTSRTLPISQHYHHFVEAGTGAVLRIFPRPPDGQFRIDFDVAPGLEITGDSWQLGAFVSHALLAAGAFAQDGGNGAREMERAVWCTGAMDPVERTVSAMSVGDKMMHPATTSVMHELVDQGVDVLFVVPKENVAEANAAVVPDWVRQRVRAVRLADEACALAGAPLPAGTGSLATEPKDSGRRAWKIAGSTAGLAAVVAAMWVYLADPLENFGPSIAPPTVVATRAPEPSTAAVETAAEADMAPAVALESLAGRGLGTADILAQGFRIVELRAPTGVGCPAVQEGAAVPDRVEAPISSEGIAVSRHGGSLCGIELVVAPDDSGLFALLIVERVTGNLADCQPMPAELLGVVPIEQEATWRCNVRQASGVRSVSVRIGVTRGTTPVGDNPAGADRVLQYRIEP